MQRGCYLALCGIHLDPLRYLCSSTLVGPYLEVCCAFVFVWRTGLILFNLVFQVCGCKRAVRALEYGECGVQGVRGNCRMFLIMGCVSRFSNEFFVCVLTDNFFSDPSALRRIIERSRRTHLLGVIHRYISSSYSSCTLHRWECISVSCLSEVPRDKTNTKPEPVEFIRFPFQPPRSIPPHPQLGDRFRTNCASLRGNSGIVQRCRALNGIRGARDVQIGCPILVPR